MKKILFIINTLRIGGAEKSLVSLLNALDYRKYDVDLLLFEDDGPLKAQIPDAVHIIYGGDLTRAMILEFRYYGLSLLKRFHPFAFLARLRLSVRAKNENRKFSWNVIKKFIPQFSGQYDVAVSYLEGYPAYYLIDKVNAKKKIAWIHTDFSKRAIWNEEAQYYSKMNQIVTISDQCKNALQAAFPVIKDRITVIENLSDPNMIKHLSEEPVTFESWKENSRHVVTVGRLTEAKGIDLAIDAYAELRKMMPDIQWHVFGDGELRGKYEKMIADHNLTESFILEGSVINPYPYMRKADLIVQPSRWEGKSVVLDEAKILGKAIIVTNYPTSHDQIQDHVNGMIADMNADTIANCIFELLNNADLRSQFEQNNLCSDSGYGEIVLQINRLLGE